MTLREVYELVLGCVNTFLETFAKPSENTYENSGAGCLDGMLHVRIDCMKLDVYVQDIPSARNT